MQKVFILLRFVVCIGQTNQFLLPLDGGEVNIMKENTNLWSDEYFLTTKWPSALITDLGTLESLLRLHAV